MDSIKHGANYVSDKVQEVAHGGSKEANKDVAKNPNAPVGTRVSAATDAVGDKTKEEKHGALGEAHKQSI